MSGDEAVDKTVDMPMDKPDARRAEDVRLAAQKKRSLWLAVALFGFVILIGLTSALQLKENIERSAAQNIGSSQQQ